MGQTDSENEARIRSDQARVRLDHVLGIAYHFSSLRNADEQQMGWRVVI